MADDLLAKMRSGVKEIYEIRLRDLVIPVRLLTVDEINLIRRDAAIKTASVQGDTVDQNLERQKSALKLASTLKTGGVPLITDKLLSLMTVDEITFLYEEYVRVMDAVNPSIQTIDPEQFRALVDALKKNTITSKDLSLHQLRAICTSYVDLIQRLETQKSHQASSFGGPLAE